MKRAPRLQEVLNKFAKDFDIPQHVIVGADHPYTCRCNTCKEYWRSLGPDPETDMYGPFTKEELGLDTEE